MVVNEELVEKMIITKTENLIDEIKKEGYVNFEKTINFLKELEDVFSIFTKYTNKEIEGFLDNLIEMYKIKIKSKELTKKQILILNDSINFIIMTLDYIPINIKGGNMVDLEFQIWKEEIWKKHLKDIKEKPKEIKKVDIEEYRETIKEELKEIILSEEGKILIDLLVKDITEDFRGEFEVEKIGLKEAIKDFEKEWEAEEENLKKEIADIFKATPSMVSSYKTKIEAFIKEKKIEIDFDITEWITELIIEVLIEELLEKVKEEIGFK